MSTLVGCMLLSCFAAFLYLYLAGMFGGFGMVLLPTLAIVGLLYAVHRAHERIHALEKRLERLEQCCGVPQDESLHSPENEVK